MSQAPAAAATGAPPQPWRRGILWLAFLGPCFFLSYGLANSLAAARGVSASIHFPWERAIPFLPWSIVPYWSIDLLYALSFFTCRSRREVDRHGQRLLAVQLASVACFLLFPLRFDFPRPPTEGVPGLFFAALASFDQPYNQAPALHISLLVVLWVRYAAVTRGSGRTLVHAWALLIAVSTLTTYQHHFFDLPSGAAVGLLALWLWPDRGPPLTARWRLAREPRRLRLAGAYFVGGGACATLALILGGGGLWLLAAALALGLVGLAYLGLGAAAFARRGDGFAPATAVLLAPYRLAAWINSRLWTRGQPPAAAITDGVWLGRIPSRDEARRAAYGALLDLAPELAAPRGPWRRRSLPWLDLLPPSPLELSRAAAAIEALRGEGKLLVYCALGYSRSAAAVAAWLLASGRAASLDEALEHIRKARPQAVIGPHLRQALESWAAIERLPHPRRDP